VPVARLRHDGGDGHERGAGQAAQAPPSWFIHAFWRAHRGLYRISGGRFLWTPSNKRGWGALRLTTVGRKSGQERHVILGYLDNGGDLVTLAMNGWDEGHPAWWRNLEARPEAVVRLARSVLARCSPGWRPARSASSSGSDGARSTATWTRTPPGARRRRRSWCSSRAPPLDEAGPRSVGATCRTSGVDLRDGRADRSQRPHRGSTGSGTSRPYEDLDGYLALPRISGLALSPDGARLVTTVATLDRKATRYVSGLWEVDPSGERPAARLTRSAKGEGGPVFTPDGEVLFTSARPDPDGEGDDEAPAALWRLPRTGEPGCWRPARRHRRVVVAREAGRVAVLSDTLPASTDTASDEARRKARKDNKVDAVLHTGFPVRYWDADLGPGSARLLTAELPTGGEVLEWRDLTPAPGARCTARRSS
jgi:deazaflavin-dependent oxidoreductase (nitroreductase family)